MKERDELLELLEAALDAKSLRNDVYKNRLALEVKELDVLEEHEYFLKLVKEGKRFLENENNLLVPYLLGLCPDFNIDKEPAYNQGEFPDIDMDYLPAVRDHLKNEWAVKEYGRDFVCSIGTYGTLGIKAAMLDMARIHGVPKDEVQMVTKQVQDKDDEGEAMEWDKALELYADFKGFCDRHPDVATAAKMMLERNKSGGVHAGGLIISSKPIHNFVPLEVRSVKKEQKHGVLVSAWCEGQATQDLQPVGLVKFDLLVVDGLMQIAQACELIRQRHGIERINALPGGRNWSDTAYLNDPKALAMADKADLKCVFQFGSDGIRTMVKRGGVDSFDDLMAYSALYRPGPLNMGMDKHFCDRKKKVEAWTIHPLLFPILGKTYGVLVFQEQCMQVLHTVGLIPLIHCEKVRKAISKKKIALFGKYKEQFIVNGQVTLGETEEFVRDLWDQIEAFADYGFNASMTIRTSVTSVDENNNQINKEIQNFASGDRVLSVDELGNTVISEVVQLHDHGEIYGYEVTFDDGHSVVCSMDHKFLTEFGQKSLRKILGSNLSILCDERTKEMGYAKEERGWLDNSVWNDGTEQEEILRTQQVLCGMSGEVVCDGRVEISLRAGVQDEHLAQETSASMRAVPHAGLESKRKWRDRGTQGTLRSVVGDVSLMGRASTRVPTMFGDQEREYHQEESKNKSIRGAQVCFIESSQKNFNTSRDSESTSGKTSFVARSEPGQIRFMYGVHAQESEAFQNGELASERIEVGDVLHSLRREPEASGFCEGQYLDRSRRILPLLREPTSGIEEKISAFCCSTKGCDAQLRSEKPWECDVAAAEHGVFCEFDGCNEAGCMGLGAGYAHVTDTGRLVRRKIVRVVPVGKRRMYDLEVAINTHNFLLPNGVVTSNSHSCAYTYISSRQLWLKAHYPLEYYTAVLMCEDQSDKIKEIKLDAKKHGIEVKPVSINQSRELFRIVDNDIYYGFSNLKKVGEAVAKKIVAEQPYASFEDFLARFGTEQNVLKPLISLGVFEEKADKITLYKFYEKYKDWQKKRESRDKRFEESQSKYETDLRELLVQYGATEKEVEAMARFDEDVISEWETRFGNIKVNQEYKYKGETRTREVSVVKFMTDVHGRRNKAIRGHEEKTRIDEEEPPTLATFNAKTWPLEQAVLDLLMEDKAAEQEYYGFQWIHDLEESPDYEGYTIDRYTEVVEKRAEPVGAIEIKLLQVTKREFKTGTIAYDCNVEDANGKIILVRFWKDDYERFQDELKVGALLRIRVRPPQGFPSYSFDSPPRHLRHKALPKDKSLDHRLFVMMPGAKKVITQPHEAVEEGFEIGAME